MLIPNSLTTEQIQQVREAFDIFDKNKDGCITKDELKSVMLSLGLNPSETEIMDMIDSADIDKNGVIDIEEFMSLMPALTPATGADYKRASAQGYQKSVNEEYELRRAFEEFDENGDGFISPEELNRVMRSIGETLTSDEIKVIIKEVDNNGDGKIDYYEFCKIYKTR